MKVNVLGVTFSNTTMLEALDRAEALLEEGGMHYVVTPNPEIAQIAKKDEAFREILCNADLTLPDGIGVIYAAKILGRPLKCRVPGIEFASGICERIAKTGKNLFLLGAKPGVAEEAAKNLMRDYPGLVVCGAHDGYFKENGPVVDQIKESGADVVFVCLGAPKQEKWIAEFGSQSGAALLVGLGGSLDVFAGQVKRAPEVWQKLGLEWLYRLIKQPSRFGRMMKLPLFLLDAVAARISGK
jgi:N-acetylglucosaminyldiphosphoundecaprenol N-acetyl-beta-D-mannosaminyltransferase